jgi:hypothetical protein
LGVLLQGNDLLDLLPGNSTTMIADSEKERRVIDAGCERCAAHE